MMKKATLLAFCLVLPSIAIGQEIEDSKIGTRFANGIAAIAENKIITVEDIRREIQPLMAQIQQESQGNQVEFRKRIIQAENEVIQMLTDRVLIVKEFFKDKGQIPPSFVEGQREERIIRQFDGDRSKFLAYLKSIGKTPIEFDEMIRDEIIVNFMNGKMEKTASFISPVKIEAFYNENKETFFEPEQIKLRLIRLVQVADEDPDILDQTAQQIIKNLDNGSPFATQARKYSQDSKRDNGGDWGWIERKSLIKDLSDAAFGLEKEQYSQPVRVKNNIFILYVEERKEEGYTPIGDVRENIATFLNSQEARSAQERWLTRLRRDGYVRRFN